jgi:hypothetical protein
LTLTPLGAPSNFPGRRVNITNVAALRYLDGCPWNRREYSS